MAYSSLKQKMSNLVDIHPALPSQRNFIKSTWLKSFFLGRSAFCENISPDVFYNEHGDLVDKILDRASVLVAQSKDSPEVTVGYQIFELPNIIHYSYVRHKFKRYGIAKALFEASGIPRDDFYYTHRTRDCGWLVGFTKRVDEGLGTFRREFVGGKLPGGVYQPYLFLRAV